MRLAETKHLVVSAPVEAQPSAEASSSPLFPGVAALAQRLDSHLTLYDLETTTFRGQANFAITEVACITVTRQGTCLQYGSLIDPERDIDPRAEQMTGITATMVCGQPTWGEKYAALFQQFAAAQWVAGFNNSSFDNHAVIDMNARYGKPIADGFARSFDVRQLHLKLSVSESKAGNLADVARFYRVAPPESLHRAAADVRLTLEVLERMVQMYGLEAVLAQVLPKPASGKEKLSASAIARYVKRNGQASLAELATHFQMEERVVGFEVSKAIDERLVDAAAFALPATQGWLDEALLETDIDVLNSGRLKPIYESLLQRKPEGIELDYVQLRTGLMRANLAWRSLKPAS